MKSSRLLFLLLFLLHFSLFTSSAQPKRELRAAWIATVANIDWPSRNAIGHSDLQKAEMLTILDSLQALHFNAVVFQIRPTADALYYSQLEPLSSWLTGKQGQDNDIPYDPLQFVCEEAHKRCIDVHIWLNPYRVTNGFELDKLAPTHIYYQHPEWFVKYGKQWYFNPGLDETRAFLNKVVADIVERYDIDALHFDDYFYPYKITGMDFPDEETFQAHPRGFTNKEDWRRNNVNLVIEELSQTIHSRKPWVDFGISPFGVWRNAANDSIRGSQTKAGVQNYDDLYADILLWLEKGWIDYVCPQLYWEIGKKVADYETLAHWWAQYSYGQRLYIGHYASILGNKKQAEAWRIPNELCRQITLNRTIPEIGGSIYFSCKGLLQNRVGLCDSLRIDYYRYPALLPLNNQRCATLTQSPTNLQLHDTQLVWTKPTDTPTCIVYAFEIGEEICFDDPRHIFCITAENTITIPEPERYSVIAVTAVNRYKQESLPAILK